MISNTEALVIGIMAIYTIAIVYGIHHYKAKLKKLKSDLLSWYNKAMENNERNNQIQGIFQSVHEQNQSAYEQNQVLRSQVIRLQSEISELRSGIYTGYPAPTVGSFTSNMNTDTTSHYDRLQQVWNKGGMGIVNVDITPSE